MNGDQQPGNVIQPGNQNEQQEQPTPPAVSTPTPVIPPAPAPTPQPAVMQPQIALTQRPQFQPQPSAPTQQAAPSQPSDAAVSWTASEYIAHQKNFGWWLAFGTLVVIVCAAIFLWTRDIISVVAIVVIAILFGYYAGRKPVVQQYHITEEGVYIGDKLYHFSELKSFAIVRQGAFSSVEFLPLKRFMPYIPMYYAPDQEDAILNTLSQYLPFESERHQDPIDRFMHKIRF